MNIRWTDANHAYSAVVIRWETKTAEFLQIEVSPSHIFRIKIDKKKTKRGG